MTDREIMKQALDALCFGLHVGFDESSESQIKKGGVAFDQHSRAITALNERLAQPAQRTWVGLTDEDLVDCESEEDVRFVRRIEAKLKEKNT